MAKALRSYSGFDLKTAIARRIKGNTMGLGYWSAVEAEKREHAKKSATAVIAPVSPSEKVK